MPEVVVEVIAVGTFVVLDVVCEEKHVRKLVDAGHAVYTLLGGVKLPSGSGLPIGIPHRS